MNNLAHEFAQKGGRTIDQCKEEYEAACIDFAGDLQDSVGRGRLVWFDTSLNPRWRYHCAAEIDGLIHDLWHDQPMPKEQFAEVIGASNWEYTT